MQLTIGLIVSKIVILKEHVVKLPLKSVEVIVITVSSKITVPEGGDWTKIGFG